MLLKIELSKKAMKDYFVKTGIMYSKEKKWAEITFEPKDLSEEEREIIVENCDYDGYKTFTHQKKYIDKVDFDIKDVIEKIKS